jgi:hypothetical protein
MSGHHHHGYYHHGEGYCGCSPYPRSHHHDCGCHGSGGHHQHHHGGCSCGDAIGLKRRYLSPEEKKEKLVKYIDELKKELAGAEAALENL